MRFDASGKTGALWHAGVAQDDVSPREIHLLTLRDWWISRARGALDDETVGAGWHARPHTLPGCAIEILNHRLLQLWLRLFGKSKAVKHTSCLKCWLSP